MLLLGLYKEVKGEILYEQIPAPGDELPQH